MPISVEEDTIILPTPTEWEKLLNAGGSHGPFIVILYNDDWHTVDEVIAQVRKATGCGLEKARQVTMEVHHSGRAVAYAGCLKKCEEVATILRAIRLQVETDSAV
jgi:ATP-dependent Clp protease adapter protein ClpS